MKRVTVEMKPTIGKIDTRVFDGRVVCFLWTAFLVSCLNTLISFAQETKSASGSSQAVMKITDDFNDGIINPNLWLTPHGVGKVIESDGKIHFYNSGTSRNYLVTNFQHDPTPGNPITIEFDWKVKNLAENRVFLVWTRADGLNTPNTVPQNGISVGLFLSDSNILLQGSYRENAVSYPLTFSTPSIRSPVPAGEFLPIKIIDNGQRFTVTINNTSSFIQNTINPLTNFIQFSGGEEGTGEMDNVCITGCKSLNVVENSPNGTLVGTLSTNNPDTNNSLTYAITSGNNNDAFSIDNRGNITVANSTQIDLETKPRFDLEVTLSDSRGIRESAEIIINVVELNKPPKITPKTIMDDFNDGVLDSTIWTTPQGNVYESGGVLILPSSGETRNYLVTKDQFDPSAANPVTIEFDWIVQTYERNRVFAVLTRADGSNTAGFGLARNGVDIAFWKYENEQFIHANASVIENSIFRSPISGDASGQIPAPATDSVRVRVTDDGLNVSLGMNGTELYTFQENFNPTTNFIQIAGGEAGAGVLDNICITGFEKLSVVEKSLKGTIVGTVLASDPNADDTLTYSIINGNPNDAFAIDERGNIIVSDSTQLDFDAIPSYSLQVKVSDSGLPSLSDYKTFLINVKEVNVAPAEKGITIILVIVVNILIITFALYYYFHLQHIVAVSKVDLLKEKEARLLVEKELQYISEWEQNRIGQDLHDSVIQQLTGVRMMGEAILKKDRNQTVFDEEFVKKLNDHLMQSIQQLRGVSKGLYPIVLHKEGLQTALYEMIKTIQNNYSQKGHLHCIEFAPIDDEMVKINLFRIAQEAVNNIVKHSNAESFEIELIVNGDCIHLTIRDNGEGFAVDDLPYDDGMGLKIMQYRANIIGATMSIQSQTGKGTTVQCTLKTVQP